MDCKTCKAQKKKKNYDGCHSYIKLICIKASNASTPTVANVLVWLMEWMTCLRLIIKSANILNHQYAFFHLFVEMETEQKVQTANKLHRKHEEVRKCFSLLNTKIKFVKSLDFYRISHIVRNRFAQFCFITCF